MFRWSPHGSLMNRDVQLPRWYYFDIVRSQVYSLGGLPFIWIIAVDIFMSSTEMVEKNLRQIWQPLRHRCHCSVFVDTIYHQTSIRTNDCLLCCNSHRFATCTRTHNISQVEEAQYIRQHFVAQIIKTGIPPRCTLRERRRGASESSLCFVVDGGISLLNKISVPPCFTSKWYE